MSPNSIELNLVNSSDFVKRHLLFDNSSTLRSTHNVSGIQIDAGDQVNNKLYFHSVMFAKPAGFDFICCSTREMGCLYILLFHDRNTPKGETVLSSVVVNFHIFNFFSITARLILIKLGRDEVLMVPYKFCCLSARSAQGRIKGGAEIGHGVPFFKKLLLQTEKQQKQNASQWSRSMWEDDLVLLFLVPCRSQIFDAFLTFFGLSHFCVF